MVESEMWHWVFLAWDFLMLGVLLAAALWRTR